MVNTRPPVITPGEIDALKRKGWSDAEVAREYGVTRQHINQLRKQRTTYLRTAREEARDYFPWHAGKPFTDSAFDRKLRDHSVFMLFGESELSAGQLKRLENFYEKLSNEDLVVEFHPEIEPHRENKHGGYAYRARKTSDGDLIIRVNELATMTPVTRKVWRMPKKMPKTV